MSRHPDNHPPDPRALIEPACYVVTAGGAVEARLDATDEVVLFGPARAEKPTPGPDRSLN